MNRKITFSILFCISLIVFMASLGFGLVFLIDNEKPYIEKNSIVYHLDESNTITSVEITITNTSLKGVKSQDLILRYCREDRYPEGYSSPVVFSLNPLESKTIIISEFRNAWVYNESYHIEADRIDLQNNIPLSIENYSSRREFGLTSLALIIPSFASCLICVNILRNCQKNKEEHKKTK
ncbi:MAG: hypothetical protein E7375_03230 [Clostridiales bacterium]|nr:hypothetical protein [Clostridiales bacterium]